MSDSMYHRYMAGIEGEISWANFLTENLTVSPIIIYDYRFEVDGKERQIDCLMIFENECVLIEVKNYKGEYIFKNDCMYFLKGLNRLESQPFMQVETTANLFAKLLREESIPLQVSRKVVFTNPEFYMYGDNEKMPVVYKATMLFFIEVLNNKRCVLHSDHEFIFNKLMNRRVLKSKYDDPILKEYDEFKKGVCCSTCEGFMYYYNRKSLKCECCGNVELWQDSLLRAIREFSLTFPERKITVPAIVEWTDGVFHRNSVLKILKEHCDVSGVGRGRYYVLKNNLTRVDAFDLSRVRS